MVTIVYDHAAIAIGTVLRRLTARLTAQLTAALANVGLVEREALASFEQTTQPPGKLGVRKPSDAGRS